MEVKGSWNPTIETDIENQLTRRYLSKNGLTHGIYVVFWFDPASWNETDQRRKQVRFRSADEARATLSQEAARLSASGLRVEVCVLDASLVRPRDA
jgi:hypothetical protein